MAIEVRTDGDDVKITARENDQFVEVTLPSGKRITLTISDIGDDRVSIVAGLAFGQSVRLSAVDELGYRTLPLFPDESGTLTRPGDPSVLAWYRD